LNIPHASKKLNKTTIRERSTNDKRRLRQAPCAHIDQREQERRQRESAQTQRRRVGELAALGALVGTGLEFTTEGRQTHRVARVDVRERVAAVVVGLALLGGMVVVGVVVADDAVAVLLAAEVARVDRVVFLGGRHCGLVGMRLWCSRV